MPIFIFANLPFDARLRPRMSISPAVLRSKEEIILIVVLLPAPFAPRKPKISPSRTLSDILSTAMKSPNFLVKLRISSTFIRITPFV